MKPEVIYEDDSMVVINKPTGMVSNKSQTIQIPTVQDWFAPYVTGTGDSEFYQKGGLIHRLDKDTSGIMVLGRTEESYNFIKQQFLERRTVKKYWALVHGVFDKASGLITAPIERHPKDKHKFTVGKDLSRTSITEWRVVEKINDFTFLELIPHTGRTHQLRVHLQYIHHPIVSDPIYGFQKRVSDDLVICPRLFLHAFYLEFTHPVSHERVHFEAPLPQDLSQAKENLIH